MLARLATCVLVVSFVGSVGVQAAFADRANRSIASCTSFDQTDKDDETVQFTFKNSCTIPVDCDVSWKVVCAPESKKRRATHEKALKLSLSTASTQTADASAAVCGDASWTIDAVQWSCAPTKD